MTANPAQCPMCGWTGQESDLEADGEERNCPACEMTVKRI